MEEEVKVEIEVQEEPTGGGIKEEIILPTPPVRGLPETFGPPRLPSLPAPKLPMGTITETITIPAAVPTYNNKQSTPKKMFPQGEIEQIKTEPNGTITIKREICDGEVHLGPFKSCLKEFTGVPAVGWIAAAAGLIVLWKWLDYRFKK